MKKKLTSWDFSFLGEWKDGCYILEIDASLTTALEILFNQNQEACYLEIKNYGLEFEVGNEEDEKVLKSLYVQLGDHFYTLDEVITYAESSLYDVLQDVEKEGDYSWIGGA